MKDENIKKIEFNINKMISDAIAECLVNEQKSILKEENELRYAVHPSTRVGEAWYDFISGAESLIEEFSKYNKPNSTSIANVNSAISLLSSIIKNEQLKQVALGCAELERQED